jgi:hypothetical protein
MKMLVVFVLLSVRLLAQMPAYDRYTWTGDVVSYDQAANVLTVKARYREHVNAYIGRFTRGDKLVLVWATPKPGETEAITYIEKYDPKSAVLKIGYVLPAEFLGADPAHFQLTFALTPPPNAAAVLKTARPGSQFKFVSPFDQPNDIPIVTSIELPPGSQALTSNTSASAERRNQP